MRLKLPAFASGSQLSRCKIKRFVWERALVVNGDRGGGGGHEKHERSEKGTIKASRGPQTRGVRFLLAVLAFGVEREPPLVSQVYEAVSPTHVIIARARGSLPKKSLSVPVD